jgi:hypothetical protein
MRVSHHWDEVSKDDNWTRWNQNESRKDQSDREMRYIKLHKKNSNVSEIRQLCLYNKEHFT